MRLRRVVLVLLALAVLLPALAAATVVLLFDGEALKPRAADAVRQATGRELSIAGPVRLGWSLTPTVSATAVSLANPSGMSRPAMAMLDRVDVQVALWPLLRRRVEVRGITLIGPDVLLERDAAGQPNWVFARPAAPSSDSASAAPGTPAARMQVSVDAIQVRDGRLGWLSGGRLDTLAIAALQARTEAPGTVRVAGTLDVNDTALNLQGTTGTLANAGGAWPVDLSLSGGGATLRAAGALGAAVALTAEIPDLAALSSLAGRPLPPLRDIHGSAQLGPLGLSALNVQAAGELGALRLTRLQVTAAAPDQPVSLSAEGVAGTGPVTLTATTGSLAALLRPGTVPVQGQAQIAGAVLTAEGTADPRSGIVELQVSARVPDMQALGAAAGVRLPALRGVTLDARASNASPGVVVLRGLRAAARGADVAGDLAITTAPRPAIRGSLVSQRLDLDALAASMASAALPASPAVPAAPVPAAPVPAAPVPAAPALAAPPARLLPDAPLPFEALRRGDADLQLSVNEATWRGVPFRAVSARLLLQEGRLRLDPVQAQVPGGPAAASLAMDAGAQTASLSLQSQGLAAGPLLSVLLGQEAGAGTLDLDIALQGKGASPRALAATLDGHAGVALVDGEFDLGGIMAALGDALPKGLPMAPGGRSHVRCLALRVDAAAGQAALRTLLLDSARLHLEGEGTVNLADETLDLHLRPQVRLGLGGVSVPVHVSGPIRAPRTQAEIKGGTGRPGLLIGAPPPPDECAARLAEARGGRAGPLPAGAPDAPRPKPADLFRNLFR